MRPILKSDEVRQLRVLVSQGGLAAGLKLVRRGGGRPRLPARHLAVPRARLLVLKLSGHTVEVQTTSEGALEAVNTFQPEAVVLDLGLPTMDGFDVARRLRETHDHASLLLIALSGYGQQEHRQHSRQAGFDYHLTKPADLTVLLDLLAGAADTSQR